MRSACCSGAWVPVSGTLARWAPRGPLLSYGLLIEGIQAVLPTGRSAEWFDALANTLGLFAGLASLKWLFHQTEFLKWRD